METICTSNQCNLVGIVIESDIVKEKDAWQESVSVAKGVYYGYLDTYLEGATHYGYYVNPSWAETKAYITRIDDHIFYR